MWGSQQQQGCKASSTATGGRQLTQSSDNSSVSLVHSSSAKEQCWGPRALLSHSLVYKLKASNPPQKTPSAPGHSMLQALLSPRAWAKVMLLPAQHSTSCCR